MILHRHRHFSAKHGVFSPIGESLFLGGVSRLFLEGFIQAATWYNDYLPKCLRDFGKTPLSNVSIAALGQCMQFLIDRVHGNFAKSPLQNLKRLKKTAEKAWIDVRCVLLDTVLTCFQFLNSLNEIALVGPELKV